MMKKIEFNLFNNPYFYSILIKYIYRIKRMELSSIFKFKIFLNILKYMERKIY